MSQVTGRICPECGEVPDPGKRWNAVYCSVQCQVAASCRRLREQTALIRAARICPVCSRPVPAARGGRAIYCSDLCKERRSRCEPLRATSKTHCTRHPEVELVQLWGERTHRRCPQCQRERQQARPGYSTAHHRLHRIRGKAETCVFGCVARRYEWANLMGDYGDLDDFTQMCPSCHRKFDRSVRMTLAL